MSQSSSPWLDRRRAGILLHISSLPGPQPKGCLGEQARALIDGLVCAGHRVWQFLPLGPTHGHGSPYESLSSIAGNPEFIDLSECVHHGWLSQPAYQHFCQQTISMNDALKQCAAHFWQACEQDHALAQAVHSFSQQAQHWLEDYALFTALKDAHSDQAWWQWEQPLRDREPDALAAASQQHHTRIQQTVFEQFLFTRQWQQLKAYAEERDVQLFGDIPIYVAHDSADAWVYRHYFTINAEGLCDEVAGVPPDYFSETGQRWGNPLYRWDVLQADGFAWWIERVRSQYQRMHLIRIDHFRGLEAYWTIPGHSKDGRIGEWQKAPGERCLEAIKQALGTLPLVAEDLGIITPEVDAMRQAFNLPGMKILQFAFGGDASNPYLPHQHTPDSVAYTGTHDNNTSLGWYEHASAHEQQHLQRYLGVHDDSTMPWPLIQSCLASVAKLAIVPMQDVLELDSNARFNTPGTVDGNWSWRMDTMPNDGTWDKLQQLSQLYGRY